MKTTMMRCATAAVLCALGACGGAVTQVAEPPKAVPEKPPEPPEDPLAWLPPEASVLGRIDLVAFRATPYFEHMPDLEEETGDWLEVDPIDVVSVAFEPREGQEASVVGVLEGRFEEGYLAGRAQRAGIAPAMHGERSVYVRDGTYWVQPRVNLLVGCTADALDWVLSRYEAGPDAEVRSTDLFTSLAPVVEFDAAHVAVLLQDRDGTARSALQEAGGAQTSVLTRVLKDVVRGAVRVQFGDGLAVHALADADTAPHAQELLAVLQGYLDHYMNSPLVLLLGLRDLLASIRLSSEESRVSLSAHITQAHIDGIIERLQPMLEGLFVKPQQAQPPPPPAPGAPAAPVPAEADAAAGGGSDAQ